MNIKDLKHNYSDNIFDKKILIVGICRPPLGGIPIHIDRVQKKFIAQNNLVKTIDVIKENKKTKLSYLLFLLKEIFKIKPDFVFYHTLTLRKNLFEIFFLILTKIFLKYNLITIIHTPRFFYEKKWFYKKTLNYLINFIDKQILIGTATYQSYIDNNISLKNSLIESPFIVPDLSDEKDIFSSYPNKLIDFIKTYKPIILINGSQMKIWNNVDLYGFDMAIQLINDLHNDFENIGLIIAISSIGDIHYFEKIKSIVKSKKNIFLFLENKNELWPLIKKSDLLIRPTFSDSYAISVAEAVYLKTPVIASDVCLRFNGTNIFESRNQQDLNAKVKNLLNKVNSVRGE